MRGKRELQRGLVRGPRVVGGCHHRLGRVRARTLRRVGNFCSRFRKRLSKRTLATSSLGGNSHKVKDCFQGLGGKVLNSSVHGAAMRGYLDSRGG